MCKKCILLERQGYFYWRDMENIAEGLLPLAVDIDSVKEDPQNARKHSSRNLAALKKSLKAYGQRKPIVVNSETGIIEAGNGLWRAAKSLGWARIAAAMVKDDPAAAKGYALMDNQSALLADWDMTVLSGLLKELDAGVFDMELTGFSEREIENLLAEIPETKVGLIDDDEVPEGEDTICQPGDLWQLGDHRLLCGDSTEKEVVKKLMGGALADLVITDPPYNVNYKSMKGNSYTAGKYGGKLKAFEDDKTLNGYHYLLTAVIQNIHDFTADKAPVYMWYADIFSDIAIGTFRQLGYKTQPSIIWLKDGIVFSYGTYHRCYEPCAYAWKDGKKPYENRKVTAKERDVWMDRMTFMDYLDVWYVARDNRNEYVHPTQKPVALTERMLRNSSAEGHKVLDLFGGSGSVLIGCEKLGRQCFVMELDPHYCSVIINRWQKYTGKKAMRIDSGQENEINAATAGTDLPTDRSG